MAEQNIAYFKRKLKIDRNDLDGALLEQPQLIFSIASKTAKGVSLRDQAKEDLKQTEAELLLEAEDSEEKRTAPQKKAWVENHERRKASATVFRRASLTADRWLAMKEAFIQRGYVLRELTQLHLAEHYATDRR